LLLGHIVVLVAHIIYTLIVEIKMAERKGRRSSGKTAVSAEMTWSAWSQKYAAKASGKL